MQPLHNPVNAPVCIVAGMLFFISLFIGPVGGWYLMTHIAPRTHSRARDDEDTGMW